jgi:hypothetical protein
MKPDVNCYYWFLDRLPLAISLSNRQSYHTMKIKLLYLAFSILILCCPTTFLKGQFPNPDEYSFGLRATDPVKMDVIKSGDKVTFSAINESYFPYELTIKFSHLENLLPRIFERKVLLRPGNNILFVLNIMDKDQSIQYEYTFNYIMRLSDNPDLSFPYLIPIGQGKIVQLQTFNDNENETILINHFKMSPGDSVFAIRKGTVTALPNDDSRVDRIIKPLSLEVLHLDGTLAIYRGLDYSNIKLHLGQIIYPGQFIGLIEKNGTLILNLLAMNGPLKLKDLEIYFTDQHGNIFHAKMLKNMKVFYPKEIIEKEMTDREIRKHEQGKLF